MNCTCSKNNIEFYHNFQLKNFNTLKMSSCADLVYFPKDEREFCSIFDLHDNVCVLGWGSNTLLSSLGIKTPLIITKKMSDISFRCNTVEVEAGASVQKLSQEACNNGLSGFEFLIGIPASLGGAVAMNAGAHQQCISDYIVCARVFDVEKKQVIVLNKDELEFSYRNSLIKKNDGRYIVLSAKFLLNKSDKANIKAKMDENTEFRKRVQPSLILPNLGSVFKNPILPNGEKLSAGMLVDKCGLKGFHINNAGVWEKHGNFVINYDNCTSVDYTNVLFKMYDSVKEKFNIELECEIVRLGQFSESEDKIWKILKKD